MNGDPEFRRGQVINPGEMAVWVGRVLDDSEAQIGPRTPLGTLRLQSLMGLQRVSTAAVRRVIDVIRNAPADIQAGLGCYISGFPDEILEQLGGITAEKAEGYLRSELDATTRSHRVNKLASRAVDGPDLTASEEKIIPDSDPIEKEQLNGSNVSLDGVHDWLNNIAKVPLLTAEQEVQIGKRIEAGLAARAALERWTGFETTLETMTDKYQDLSYEELIQALQDVARDGEEAKQHMVTANLRLVVSIAKRYERSGLPFEDRIQEGNIGLIRAVEKFDYQKGYKVSTYATWWIKQALQRAIANSSSTVRLPVNVHGAVKKMQYIRRNFIDDIGRDPTEGELAEIFGCSVQQVRAYRTHELNSRDPLSLSTPLGYDGDGTLEDFVADQSVPDAGATASHWQLAERLNSLLHLLDEREAQVVRMRYGLDGAQPKKLEEIAEVYGLTSERIRQIVNKAIARLRHPAYAADLHDLRDLRD